MGDLGKTRPNAGALPQRGPYPALIARHGLIRPCSKAGAVLSARLCPFWRDLLSWAAACSQLWAPMTGGRRTKSPMSIQSLGIS